MKDVDRNTAGYREPLIDVDLLRYWSAAVFTALIAAFAAVVTVRLAGDVFDTQLLVADRGGATELVPLADGRAFWVVIIATLTAASTLNLMLYVVPRPTRFFGVLGSLVLVLTLFWPISLDIANGMTIWLIAIHVVAGAIILGLLTSIVPVVTRPYAGKKARN